MTFQEATKAAMSLVTETHPVSWCKGNGTMSKKFVYLCDEMAKLIFEAYQKGIAEGKATGLKEGIEQGREAERRDIAIYEASKCETCRGRGEVPYGYEWYTCTECRGRGKI